MIFVGPTLNDEAASILASARDHGLTFVDIEDAYNNGEPERVLGKLLQGKRDDCGPHIPSESSVPYL